MKYFPLFMDLSHHTCLIIGGGEVALRKTLTLLNVGASITVVAETAKNELITLAKKGKITIYYKRYHNSYLKQHNFVIAATNNKAINHQIYLDCQAKKLFVNVVDNSKLSNFIFPAIINRDPITIAVSSNASSPVLSRLLRGKIESMIPFRYGELAKLAKKYRGKVKAKLQSISQQRQFWESIFQGPAASKLFNGQSVEAENYLKRQLEEVSNNASQTGEVYLVGAGPGDPELLTFKALRLMQQADIVFYDRLVSSKILALTRTDSKKFYVGKQSSSHAVIQTEINSRLVHYAQKGHRVLRLKGGDPFIFGRGGEEAEILVKYHIPFEVVPGITSAVGASSYCGIPLTHRDYAHSVTFVTGHLKNDANELDWAYLAQKRQTLVIYMGLAALDSICKKLISHQLPPATPIAIIQNATRSNQQVLTGMLTNIEDKVKAAEITSPALIIVGEVVKLRAALTS